MAITDPRVDAYIENAEPFARPILRHIRRVAHRACPDLTESIKWGTPHFEVDGILCGMGAFKAHCTLAFWNPEQVVGPGAVGGAMGEFGRITRVEDLPPDPVLQGYLRKARQLRRAGVTRPARRRPGAEPVDVPEPLARRLAGDPRARAAWEAFSPGQRRDYADWIREAKREETRLRRLARAMDWIREGKPRNWKYL